MKKEIIKKLILGSITISQKEKEKYFNLLERNTFTHDDLSFVLNKIKEEEETDIKELRRVDDNLLGLESLDRKYDKIIDKAYEEVLDFEEAKNEVKFIDAKKEIDEKYREDIEEIDDFDKEMTEIYNKYEIKLTDRIGLEKAREKINES